MKWKEEELLNHLKKEMNKFTEENYGVSLNIPVRFSGRLKRYYGFFRHKRRVNYETEGNKVVKTYEPLADGMEIVLSKSLLTSTSLKDIESVAKHEALHYALFIKGLPYADGTSYFESELKKHDLVSNFGEKKIEVVSKRWVWVCAECNKIAISGGRTRNNYAKTHRSGCCNSLLVEKGWQNLKTNQKYL